MATEEAVVNAAPAQEVRSDPPQKPKKKRRMKRFIKTAVSLILVAAILGGGAFALWYFVFREETAESEILPAVATIGSIQMKAEGYGTARPADTASVTIPANPGTSTTVGSDVYGTVLELFVEQGQMVMEGMPLFTVDSPAAEEAVNVAIQKRDDTKKELDALQKELADLNKQTNNLGKEQEDLRKDREKAIQQKGKMEERLTEMRQEKLDILAEKQRMIAEDLPKAQQELKDLQNGLSLLNVTAPFEGKVKAVGDIQVGSYVTKDQTICTLVNDRTMLVSLYFSYGYENDIKVGMPATVSVPAVMGSYPGKVEKINKVEFISPEGGTFFEVVLSMENPGTLTEEMVATATMQDAAGNTIYPYEEGTLKFSETRDIHPNFDGTVTAFDLLAYTRVRSGDVLMRQSDDALQEAIDEKQKALDDLNDRIDGQDDLADAKDDEIEGQEEAIETQQENIDNMLEQIDEKGEEIINHPQTLADKQAEIEKKTQDLEAAEQGILDAQAAVDDPTFYSPISGTVTGFSAQPGKEVKYGETVVMIADTAEMTVEITVDDRNIAYITPGKEVELSDYNGNVFIGVVTNVDTSIGDSGSMGTTNYPVTLTVDNMSGTLMQGMWLNYSFVTREATDCVTIPIQCVKSVIDSEGNEREVVFVQADSRPDNAIDLMSEDTSTDDSSGGTMIGGGMVVVGPSSSSSSTKYPTPEEGYWPVPVETGLNDRYNVEIVSGLEEGQTVFSAYVMTTAWSY